MENTERTLNGYTGQYNDFYSYALEYREMQVLEECLRNGGEVEERRRLPRGITPESLQPYVNINTAVMWYFAKITERKGGALFGRTSRPLGINQSALVGSGLCQ